jgi:hypothetical protein
VREGCLTTLEACDQSGLLQTTGQECALPDAYQCAATDGLLTKHSGLEIKLRDQAIRPFAKAVYSSALEIIRKKRQISPIYKGGPNLDDKVSTYCIHR